MASGALTPLYKYSTHWRTYCTKGMCTIYGSNSPQPSNGPHDGSPSSVDRHTQGLAGDAARSGRDRRAWCGRATCDDCHLSKAKCERYAYGQDMRRAFLFLGTDLNTRFNSPVALQRPRARKVSLTHASGPSARHSLQHSISNLNRRTGLVRGEMVIFTY